MCTRSAPVRRHASASAATPSALTAIAGAGSCSAASTRLSAAAFTTALGASAARRGATAAVSVRSSSARLRTTVSAPGSTRASSRPSWPVPPTTTTRIDAQYRRPQPLRQLPRHRYSGEMARLWCYVGRYRLRYVGGIACLIGATSLDMMVPRLLGRSLDAIEIDAGARVLLTYLGLIVAITVLQGLVRTFSRFVIFNVGRDIEYDLRNDLFAHLERLPLAFYQQRHTGDLMSRLVNDVTAVRMLLGPGILNFINTPVAYVYGLAFMLSYNVRLTLASLAVYPAALLVVKRTSRVLMERSLRVQEGLGELSNRVQENLSGMHVVKAYASEEHEVETFARLNARFQELSLRLARVRGFIIPVMGTVAGTGGLMVLWYGGQLAIAKQLSIGDLVAVLGYLARLAWPTMALGWMLSILQRGRASMQRLNELFQVTPAIASPPGATAPAALAGDLTEFPQGLDTIVGERGVTLSGGQKQRVALARVLAAAPRVLVLDDALSSVDAETERTILDQLRGFFRERTTILVAHRLTTVKEADLICVLDEGRVVELGDHESLLARGGVYADLFRQHSLEVELEAI